MFRLLKLVVVLGVLAAGYVYLSFGTLQPCAALKSAVIRDTPSIIRQAAESGGEVGLAASAIRALDPDSSAALVVVEELSSRWTRSQSDLSCAVTLGKRLFAPSAYRGDVIAELVR